MNTCMHTGASVHVHTKTHKPVRTVGWDLTRSRFKEVDKREEVWLEIFPICDTTPLTS